MIRLSLLLAVLLLAGCSTPKPKRPPEIDAGYKADQHDGIEAPSGQVTP